MMNEKLIEKLIEKLADQEHDRWSRWMKHLFEKSSEDKNGNVIIPSSLVNRWKRQIDTDYSDLSEKEKESDRIEARKTIKLMNIVKEEKMNYKNLLCEKKDLKEFSKALAELVNNDIKASKLKQAFKKDDTKIVDYIDYILSYKDKEIENIMKEFSVNYDEMVDALGKVK